MSSYTIVGRLGADPDLRFSNNGVAVARMRVAVNRGKKVNGEWQDETVWHDVTCFNELAEHAAESLTKGDEVIAEGYVEAPRTFERKQPDAEGNMMGVSLPFVANALGLSLRWASARAQAAAARKPASARPAPAPQAFDNEEPF